MPPSSNGLYATIRRGGKSVRVPSKEFKQYQKDFEVWRLTHLEQVNQAKALVREWNEGFCISCKFYFRRDQILCKNGKPKRNDTSNRLKALHDLIAQAIQIDDSYFWDGAYSKAALHPCHSEPFVDVSIDPTHF